MTTEQEITALENAHLILSNANSEACEVLEGTLRQWVFDFLCDARQHIQEVFDFDHPELAAKRVLQ